MAVTVAEIGFLAKKAHLCNPFLNYSLAETLLQVFEKLVLDLGAQKINAETEKELSGRAKPSISEMSEAME